jgi:hypothetical protein
MPIHLTERDLRDHPHIRELIPPIPQVKTIRKKEETQPYQKASMKYKAQYDTLRAGVVGFIIGGGFMAIMMVV